jgi:hypothetical protein
MPIRNCAASWLLVMAACSSQKPQTRTDNSHPDSGLSTGGASDAGTQPDADTSGSGGAANNHSGGQSSSAAGTTSSSAGSSSAAGANNASGGTGKGGASAATGGLPAGTGGTMSPGLPSLCSSKAKAAQPQAVVGLTLDPGARFVAITPDELTLVWTVASASGTTVYVADRGSSSVSWSASQTIANVPVADDAVTITPDGLTIAYVSSTSHLTIETMSRLDRISTFAFSDPASGGDFTAFNSSATLATGETYAYPVYGPHSTTFYYAVKSAAGALTWYVSGRFEAQGTFSTGSLLSFASAPSPTNVLSGVASDENTLFFVDTSSGQSSWTFYDEISLKFGPLLVLGNLGPVQPSQSCTRLYSGLAAGNISTEALQ